MPFSSFPARATHPRYQERRNPFSSRKVTAVGSWFSRLMKKPRNSKTCTYLKILGTVQQIRKKLGLRNWEFTACIIIYQQCGMSWQKCPKAMTLCQYMSIDMSNMSIDMSNMSMYVNWYVNYVNWYVKYVNWYVKYVNWYVNIDINLLKHRFGRN